MRRRRGDNSEPTPFALGPPLRAVGRVQVQVGRRRLLYFGGCDYFRFAGNPLLRAAVASAVAQAGLNVAASRVTTGNHPLYAEAERRIATFFGVEDALLCPTGYVAALVAIEGWRDHFTHAVADEQAHPCLVAGVALARRPLARFRHGDAESLRTALRRLGPGSRPLVMTDGVFANDGFMPRLGQYLALLPARGWLLVDEAHAAGVLGPQGRGAAEHCRLDDSRLLRTCTFSKAFGVYGGAVLGSADAVRHIAGRSHTFAGSTPLPLPLVAGVMTALRRLRADRARRKRLAVNTRWLKDALADAGLPVVAGPAPIVSVAAADREARVLRRRLLAAGIFPSYIRYPGGAKRGHFRFAVSSEHFRSDLERLVRALAPRTGNRR